MGLRGTRKQGNRENYIFSSLVICTPYRNIVLVVKWRRMGWAGHVERMGEGRGVHRVLVWKPEGKETIGETQT